MAAETFPRLDLDEVCRAIVAGQDLAVSIHDADFVPLYANPAYERLFGLEPGAWALAGAPVAPGVPVAPVAPVAPDAPDAPDRPKSADTPEARLARFLGGTVAPALRERGAFRGDLETTAPDGEVRHLSLSFAAIANQGRARYFGTYRDVTSRKSLEKSLHLQVDFLNNILDAVPDPIFVKDERHNWIVANAAYCDFIGLPREMIIGRNDRNYFPKEEADVFWRTDDEVFASGEENINEELFTDKNGVTHMISTKKASFNQDDGQRVLVGVFRDVTGDRRALKILADSYRQLEEAFVDLQARLRGVQTHISSEVARTEAIKGIISRSTEEFQVFAKRLGQGMSPPPPPPEESARPRMSRREHQVFILLAQGLKVKEVAERLSVSSNTVSTYRARIMKKLGASTTAELIQYALRSGMA